MTHHIRDKANQ